MARRALLWVLTALALVAAVACSERVDLGGSPGSDGGQTTTDSGCKGFAAPSTLASCSACNHASSSCQPNGCFNGYLCFLASSDCQPVPAVCGGGAPVDAGGG